MTSNLELLPKDDAPLSEAAELVLKTLYDSFDRTNAPLDVTRLAVRLKGRVSGVPELLRSALTPYVNVSTSSEDESASPTLRCALRLWRESDLRDIWHVYQACFEQFRHRDQTLDFSRLDPGLSEAATLGRLSYLLARETFLTVQRGPEPAFRINRSILDAPDLASYLRLRDGIPARPSGPQPLRADLRVVALELTGVRSFESATLTEIGNLTVFAGPNEAGKSNIIKALDFCSRTATGGFAATRKDFPRLRRATSGSGGLGIRVGLRTPTDGGWIYSLQERGPGTDILREGVTELSSIGSIDFNAGVGEPSQVRLSMDGAVVHLFDDNHDETQLTIQEGQTVLASLQDVERFKSLIELRGTLASWSIFHLEPTALSGPSGPNVQGGLKRDGADLAAALLSLLQRDRLAYDEVAKAFCALLPEAERLESEPGLTGAAQLSLRERGLTNPLAQRDFSDGMLRILAMLVLAFDPTPPALVIIEEPENGLYPRLIEAIVEILRQLSSRTQVFVTTHSVTLLNRLKPEEVVLVYREGHSSHFQRVDSRADIHAFLPKMGIGTQMLIGNLEDVS